MHKYKNTNNIYIALPDERVQCTLHYITGYTQIQIQIQIQIKHGV